MRERRRGEAFMLVLGFGVGFAAGFLIGTNVTDAVPWLGNAMAFFWGVSATVVFCLVCLAFSRSMGGQ